ncbi:MAG TPA: hypothetical protein EYQ31_10280, partial [Candidatus Handelsmanbacteria bacterium]|nr:hypothetical protein [Candidatus Handelsmanbacteria bacterium]
MPARKSTAREARNRCRPIRALAVGSGNRDDSGKLTPLDVKKGNKVLFGK